MPERVKVEARKHRPELRVKPTAGLGFEVGYSVMNWGWGHVSSVFEEAFVFLLSMDVSQFKV